LSIFFSFLIQFAKLNDFFEEREKIFTFYQGKRI